MSKIKITSPLLRISKEAASIADRLNALSDCEIILKNGDEIVSRAPIILRGKSSSFTLDMAQESAAAASDYVTIPYAANIDLNFSTLAPVSYIDQDGAITFTFSNIAAGLVRTIFILGSGNSVTTPVGTNFKSWGVSSPTNGKMCKIEIVTTGTTSAGVNMSTWF